MHWLLPGAVWACARAPGFGGHMGPCPAAGARVQALRAGGRAGRSWGGVSRGRAADLRVALRGRGAPGLIRCGAFCVIAARAGSEACAALGQLPGHEARDRKCSCPPRHARVASVARNGATAPPCDLQSAFARVPASSKACCSVTASSPTGGGCWIRACRGAVEGMSLTLCVDFGGGRGGRETTRQTGLHRHTRTCSSKDKSTLLLRFI